MSGVVAVLALLMLHPLHTTLTQLAYGDADGTVQVTVRAFADDMRAVLGGEVSDSGAARYLRSTFVIADRTGRSLPATWCGLKQTGDLLWLCLRASVPGGASGLRVRVTLLFERYDDQINIVQASYEGRRAALLFTRGDEAKALP